MRIIEDDILNAKEYLILHQVNIYGNMGGGVAACIADKYPEAEALYRQFCLDNNCSLSLLGKVFYAPTEDGSHIICNLFSQNTRPDYKGNLTDYHSFFNCLTAVGDFILKNLDAHGDVLNAVAVPYKIGCGIAGGDWFRVEKILRDFEHDINHLIKAEQLPPFEVVLYKI